MIKMFSVWDVETKNYLYSGRNSKTKEEAIESAWEYFVGGQDEFSEEELKQIAKDKEGFLRSIGLIIDEHEEVV